MKLTTRAALVLCWTTAVVVGYFAVGELISKSAIGLDWSAFAAGDLLRSVAERFGMAERGALAGIAWMIATLLAVLLVTFFVVRSRVRIAETDPARRTFLTGAASGLGAALVGTAAAFGAGALRSLFGVGNSGRGWSGVHSGIVNAPVVKTDPNPRASWNGSRVQAYRRLGRTNFHVSDIVVGSGPIQGEKGTEIVREAIDRGVNYVDTSPDYSASGSEEAVGKAVRGVRDQLFLATKFCTPYGHLPPGTPVAEYVRNVEDSLRRLQTDRVDLVHVHSCDEVERLMDPNLHEAFDRLRQQGKARFLGFSTHTPNLVEVTEAAIASGRFDVMMLAYHHGIWPRLAEVIERAREERDMGVVAMKTLKGAKHHGLTGFREQADAFSQAALRWVLSNPRISCAVISFFEYQHVDEYLAASGKALTPQDVAILEEYDRQTLGLHCAPHCGACHDSCPEGLPIADVLRHRMYFEDYGWQKEGMRLYAQLAKNASQCASCSAPCLGACPIAVPIAERMRGAHELLTLRA